MRDIELASRQTTRILNFVAAYESLGAEELTLQDVGKAVEEALSLTPTLKGIKVINECHGITVIADRLLNQLFYNLIDNSLKHGEKVSQIRFRHEEGKDGLGLFYEDDGVGIPKAMKSKILGRAFTAGARSGYGLPLIKKMMEVYGWQIEEKGEPGKGAKFVITIPKTHIAMRACNT
jgi:signal transduction histidine kinase